MSADQERMAEIIEKLYKLCDYMAAEGMQNYCLTLQHYAMEIERLWELKA